MTTMVADEDTRYLVDVASVWLPNGPFGSGRLILPGLVLTAAHTVAYPDNAPVMTGWQVRLLGQRSMDGAWHNDPYEAECVWRGENVDLALLRIGNRSPAPAFNASFCTIAGELDGLEATGYPQATWDAEKVARDYRVTGRLRSETVDWPFAFSIPLADAPADLTKWQGMSGAVVIGRNPPNGVRVFGAVESVDEMFAQGKLYIARVEAALEEQSFRAILTEAIGHEPILVTARQSSIYDLASDMAAMRRNVKDVYDRAWSDRALPLDFETEISTEGTLRFSPRNTGIPFVGRKSEIAALHQFLDAEMHFAWWLIVAAGGAGKTRLAREFCQRAHLRGWRAGFLPNYFAADLAGLENWDPEFPTLIVADYVQKRATEIRKLAARLGRRSGRLGRPPIRLLLIERSAGKAFEKVFYGSDQSDRSVILAARYQEEPLKMTDLSEDELWSIVKNCPWRQDGKQLTLGRKKFAARLSKLDQRRRVLIGMILADAIATGVDRGRFTGLEEELRDLLRRDRDHLWPAELCVSGRSIGDTDADVAIAFATMVDGLGPPEMKMIERERGEALPTNLLPFCAEAIGKPLRQAPVLGRMEPDLLGEFFVLETLSADPDNPFASPQHDWMIGAAWRARGRAMQDFVVRARQSFPQHPVIKKIAVPVPGVSESWELIIHDAISGHHSYAAVFDAREDVRIGRMIMLEPSKSDAAAAKAFAGFVIWAASREVQVIDCGRIAQLLDDLHRLTEVHSGEPDLRLAFGQAVILSIESQAEPYAEIAQGQIPAIVYGDPGTPARFCSEYLERLQELQSRYLGESRLREAWAAAATVYIQHETASEPVAARQQLRRLAYMQRSYPEERSLREHWAVSIPVFVLDYVQRDSSQCRALLDDLAEAYDNYADEPVLRIAWAHGVVNFVRHRGGAEPAASKQLLDRLAGLYRRYNEPELRYEWAAGVTNFMFNRDAMDDVGKPLCPVLFQDLEELHTGYPGEPGLREEWAWSVANFVFGAANEVPSDCRNLLDRLALLVAKHPAEPRLRMHYARGAANLINHWAAGGPESRRELVDALATLSASYPAEKVLQEQLAYARKALSDATS